MCEVADKIEMFLKIPDERALRYGFSARLGARCLECSEVMAEINVVDGDVTRIVLETRIVPEVFSAPPLI